MKKKSVLSMLFLLSIFNGFGQLNYCFYLDKPITQNDSVAWSKQNVKLIERTEQRFNSTDTNKNIEQIDTVLNGCQLKCLFEIEKRNTKSNSIEEYLILTSRINGGTLCKLKRTLFYDKEGNIIKIKNKHIEGQRNEEWIFSQIEFKYDKGLLKQSVYYSKIYKRNKSPYLIVDFNYY